MADTKKIKSITASAIGGPFDGAFLIGMSDIDIYVERTAEEKQRYVDGIAYISNMCFLGKPKGSGCYNVYRFDDITKTYVHKFPFSQGVKKA